MKKTGVDNNSGDNDDSDDGGWGRGGGDGGGDSNSNSDDGGSGLGAEKNNQLATPPTIVVTIILRSNDDASHSPPSSCCILHLPLAQRHCRHHCQLVLLLSPTNLIKQHPPWWMPWLPPPLCIATCPSPKNIPKNMLIVTSYFKPDSIALLPLQCRVQRPTPPMPLFCSATVQTLCP